MLHRRIQLAGVTYLGGGVDVRDVSSDTGGEADIVEAEVRNLLVLLEQERELFGFRSR